MPTVNPYDAVFFSTNGCPVAKLHVSLNNVSILTLDKTARVATVKKGRELEAIAWMVQYLTGVFPEVKVED